MHSRRFLAFFLGLWLAALLVVTFVTNVSSTRTVDVVMHNPPYEASKWMDILGKERTRTLLLHNSAEGNRSLLESWGYADFCLCVFILITAVLIKSGKPMMIASAVLVILCLASVFLLTPRVVAVGRLLDFRAGFPIPPERSQFDSLNYMFHGISTIRILTAGAMISLLLRRSARNHSRRSSRSDEINPVNYTDHSHINR